MCCGLTSISCANSPSSTFHRDRQYWPVDSMATSVTWQFFSQPRNCFRSRVNVRNFRLLTSRWGCPAGGSTHTVTLFLWISMPQQRRCLTFTKAPSDHRAKDAWMSKRHSYTCSPPGGGDDKVWFQKLRPDQVHKRAQDGAKWKSASDSQGICLHPGKPVKCCPFSSTSVDAPKRVVVVHNSRDICIFRRIKRFQPIWHLHRSFSTPRCVPCNREPGRNYDVPGH